LVDITLCNTKKYRNILYFKHPFIDWRRPLSPNKDIPGHSWH
jgi:hypothetical protein